MDASANAAVRRLTIIVREAVMLHSTPSRKVLILAAVVVAGTWQHPPHAPQSSACDRLRCAALLRRGPVKCLHPQRQFGAEPRGMGGMIGGIVTGLRVQ